MRLKDQVIFGTIGKIVNQGQFLALLPQMICQLGTNKSRCTCNQNLTHLYTPSSYKVIYPACVTMQCISSVFKDNTAALRIHFKCDFPVSAQCFSYLLLLFHRHIQ